MIIINKRCGKDCGDKGVCNMKKRGNDIRNWGKLLALLLVTGILCCFVAKKEGYHMDELLSFELSNALYNPWIVPTQPVGRLAKFMEEEIKGESLGETVHNLVEVGWDVVKNRGNSKLLQFKADVYPEPVWISGERFTEYVTAGKGDRFQYFSVYFNVKDDNHPPFHFMLLHTMSSLFPGKVEPFLGCAINILAILGCIICFFRLGRLLEQCPFLPAGFGTAGGIAAGLLYGCSVGGIRTALLIRMYGLMTFFCVCLFYMHVRKWMERGFEKKNRGLAMVTMLGFWTQYFFLFYCLALAAVTVGLLAAKKRFRELKRYLRTMILAGVIGVAAFPFSISDVFSSGRGVEALESLSSGLSGYGYRLVKFAGIFMEAGFGKIIFGLAVLVLLGGCVCAGALRNRKASMEKAVCTGEQAGVGEGKALFLLFIVPPLCYFLLAARTAPYLVDRYLMPLFPFLAMFLVLLFGVSLRLMWGRDMPVSRMKAGCACLAGLVCLVGAVNLASYDGTYLYQGYDRQLKVAEEYGDLPCVCLYDGTGYYENLLEFTRYDKTLLLKLPELEQRQDASELTQMGQMVVLKKGIVEEESALAALGQYGWMVEKVLLSGEDSVYGDTVYLCRRGTDRGESL